MNLIAGKKHCSNACQKLSAALSDVQLDNGNSSLAALAELGLPNGYYLALVMGRHSTAPDSNSIVTGEVLSLLTDVFGNPSGYVKKPEAEDNIREYPAIEALLTGTHPDACFGNAVTASVWVGTPGMSSTADLQVSFEPHRPHLPQSRSLFCCMVCCSCLRLLPLHQCKAGFTASLISQP